MYQATVIFHRQVIRLCKGVIKAWEQWVDCVELESLPKTVDREKVTHDQEVKK